VKKTGISAITGKTVVIRRATEWDMVFIEENLKKTTLTRPTFRLTSS
jgi:hypothetical protein